MSILGGFQYPKPSSNSKASDVIYNVNTFPLSGLSSSAGIPMCLYLYDNGKWRPVIPSDLK